MTHPLIGCRSRSCILGSIPRRQYEGGTLEVEDEKKMRRFQTDIQTDWPIGVGLFLRIVDLGEKRAETCSG
jgi:hypothetical protein